MVKKDRLIDKGFVYGQVQFMHGTEPSFGQKQSFFQHFPNILFRLEAVDHEQGAYMLIGDKGQIFGAQLVADPHFRIVEVGISLFVFPASTFVFGLKGQ